MGYSILLILYYDSSRVNNAHWYNTCEVQKVPIFLDFDFDSTILEKEEYDFDVWLGSHINHDLHKMDNIAHNITFDKKLAKRFKKESNSSAESTLSSSMWSLKDYLLTLTINVHDLLDNDLEGDKRSWAVMLTLTLNDTEGLASVYVRLWRSLRRNTYQTLAKCTYLT